MTMLATVREKLKGWKTVIVNAVVGLAAIALVILQQIQGIDITPLLAPGTAPKVLAGLAVLNIVLRVVTTGPVGSKGETPPTVNTKAGD